MTVWGIVPAGGSGVRFGARKQYLDLGGATLLERAIACLAPVCDGIVVALPAGDEPVLPPEVIRVVGGGTRLDSVRSALAAIPATAEVIVIHGPSHPLATDALARAVVAAVRSGADAAFPGLPVLDALKLVGPDGRVVRTVPKQDVVLAQTPQAFTAAALRAAHAGTPDTAEDSELVDRAGGRVVVVAGAADNLHVATPADLAVAARLVTPGSDPCQA